ncbi:MAG: ubiquinol-cytochrome c reductase iron-sulfur subunit, partial [Aeoliella sp.]
IVAVRSANGDYAADSPNISVLPMKSSIETPSPEPRRSFFTKFLASLAGVVALLVPLGSGIVVLLDPVNRKRSAGKWVRIATLDALPADGKPHRFAVVDERPTDKWNLYDPQPVGSVYLTRAGEEETPIALSAVCPHLGCSVDFKGSSNEFHCPCHNADFQASGARTDVENSVSPRDLDRLEVEVRDGNEIWVDYRKFKAGVEEKIEV